MISADFDGGHIEGSTRCKSINFSVDLQGGMALHQD